MAKTDNVKKKPIANKDYKSDKQLARLAEKKKSEQKAAIKKLLVPVIAVVVAIAIVVSGVLVAYNAVLNNGALLRSRSAMLTKNFTVTNAMMSYYVFDQYHDYVESLGGEKYAASKGLDINKSLKKQAYSSGVTTWFDHFLSLAQTETEDMLIYLEGAKAAGVELTAEELAAVKAEAAQLNVADYGRGVRVEDIEKALEYRALSEKFAKHLEDSITVTDEEREAYYEENKDAFLRTDYLRYVIYYDLEKEDEESAESTEEPTEEPTEAPTEEPTEAPTEEPTEAPTEEPTETPTEEPTENTESAEDTTEDAEASDEETEEETKTYGRDAEAAEKLADELAACTDKDAFIAKIKDLFGEESETLAKDLLVTGLQISEGKTLNDWAFAEDTVVGDTLVIENSSAGYFTVYMLDKTAYRSETPVATLRRILIEKEKLETETAAEDEDDEETETYESDEDYKARVKAILDEYLAGEKTAEAFGALADEYSDDTTYAGGLYQNLAADTMGETIAQWVYDEARVQGDAEMILDAGEWNIVYFDSLGDAAWYYEAGESLYKTKLAEAQDALYKADVTVIAHYNYMNSIPA